MRGSLRHPFGRRRTRDGLRSGVREQLEERSVRIAEVHTRALPSRAVVADRAGLDRDPVLLEVLDRGLEGARPDEAEIAVAGLNWQSCVQALEARPVDVEVPLAEDVMGERFIALDDFGAEDVAVEGVRAVPVGDRDDAVIECQAHAETLPRRCGLCSSSAPSPTAVRARWRWPRTSPASSAPRSARSISRTTTST